MILRTAQHEIIAGSSIEEVVSRIFASGKITRADEHWLHQATMSDVPLSGSELNQIRRVMDRLRMGLLRVVD